MGTLSRHAPSRFTIEVFSTLARTSHSAMSTAEIALAATPCLPMLRTAATMRCHVCRARPIPPHHCRWEHVAHSGAPPRGGVAEAEAALAGVSLSLHQCERGGVPGNGPVSL